MRSPIARGCADALTTVTARMKSVIMLFLIMVKIFCQRYNKNATLRGESRINSFSMDLESVACSKGWPVTTVVEKRALAYVQTELRSDVN